MRIQLKDFVKPENKITTIFHLLPTFSFEYDDISTVIEKMVKTNYRRLPIITKNEDLVGIITYTDVLDALLRGMSPKTQVSTFMIRDVVRCDANDMIYNVFQKLKISKRGGLPVTSGKKLIGVVSERDFVSLLKGKHLSIPVTEIMTKKPFYIPYNTSIFNCIKSMINTHYRRFPVVENKKLIGIVTALDVLNYLVRSNFNITYLNETIDNIMKSPVYSLSEHDDVSDAIKIILENSIGGLIVIKENSPIGIITERDILNSIDVSHEI